MLCLQLIGISVLAIALSPEFSIAFDDLEFKENNFRRILHGVDDEKSENRTKRLRQASIEKTTTTPSPDDEEDKKTLAQQVADGKYGLIQKELFATPAQRPGILSYEVNPEVPKDNVNNLGGLQPEEIWLAENHLLVLKGGIYSENDQNGKAVWPPIDNYIAPQRQVKIPPNPKIPPPFPIQLTDGGPVEFIKGTNGTAGPLLPFFDPRLGPPNFFPLPPFIGPGQNRSQFGDQGNSTEGNGLNPPFPFPPPAGIGLFPPAIAFLPPPGNLTELDEDDPSIYYPPPYDFVYQKDNSSFVSPGPLVPGIVLPPPPDFFAIYDNKTKLSSMKQLPPRKLTKQKSRPTQYIQEAVLRKTNRPTKPPSSTVTISIVTPQTTTTLAPIVVSTTDTSQNEIIPPRTLPLHTPVGEWVPIPAPRPFYISELKNLRSGNKIKYGETPITPWGHSNSSSTPLHVPKNENIQNSGEWVRGYDYTPPQKKGRHFPTPAPPVSGFKPIYVPPTLIHSSTVKPSTVVYTSTFNSVKAPDNYYFYDKPVLNNYSFRKRPLSDFFSYNHNKNSNEVNTVAPAELYNDVSVKSPADIGNIPQSHFDFYRQQFETSTTTSSPINYYYFDKTNPTSHRTHDHPFHNVEELHLHPPKGIKVNRVNNKKLNPPLRTTTEKPPIFEYSYSAPGYGTIESPKVGTSFVTTSKPVAYDVNFPAENDHHYSYFHYPNTQKPSNYYSQETTPLSIYYTTLRPNYAELDGYNKGEVHKAKASYSSGPKLESMGLEDDAKKYFSMFGQKLHEHLPDSIVTTPITLQSTKSYYNNNFRSNDYNREKETHKQTVKFPSDDYYDNPNEQLYYPLPHKPVYKQSSTNRLNHQQHSYPNYYRLSSPQYDPYGNYDDDEEEAVSPGHQLHTDINVNLKLPSTQPLEPDAELIDPAYVRPRGSAFISYQLPGSGGHFYFLTPQTIKAPYPPEPFQEFSGYYKRNVQSKPRIRQNSRKS